MTSKRAPDPPWLDIRKLFPGATLPPYLLSTMPDGSALDAVSLKCELVTVDAAGCTDERSVLGAIGTALSFPDYYGRNWDAFDDCLADRQASLTRPLLILVSGLDDMPRYSIHTFVRIAHMLSLVSYDWSRAHSQVEFVLIGDFGVDP